MALLDIIEYPDPILKQQTEAVKDFDAQLVELLENMKETMYDASGIGLAAPQIGLLKRITVIDVSEERDQPLEVINPEIIAREGEVASEEGCLSIPDYRDTVSRSASVVVRAQDRHGDPFELEADELLAICLQHEIDHLEGILFIDHLSRLKREMFKRWHKKKLRAEAEE